MREADCVKVGTVALFVLWFTVSGGAVVSGRMDCMGGVLYIRMGGEFITGAFIDSSLSLHILCLFGEGLRDTDVSACNMSSTSSIYSSKSESESDPHN